MTFVHYLLPILFTFVVTLTAVQSYRLIVEPRSDCCSSKLGRSAFVPLAAAIAEASMKMIQSKGHVDRLRLPEEKSFDADLGKPDLLSGVSSAQEKDDEKEKAFLCSKMTCSRELFDGPVCACNFKTGNVISFKNKCDLKKHNCRFDTGFKAILGDICPWEFQSRRSGSTDRKFDYDNPKYYN